MLAINKIHCMNCVSGMKKLSDNSVDIIVADPPYNIGKDFGNNKDKMPLAEYLKWTDEWLQQAFRVLKPSGTLYVYGFSEILARVSVLVDIDKQRWIIWHYTNKNIPSLNFWQRSHESILVCWKDKPLFNRDDVREPYTDSFLKNSAGKVRTGTKSRFGCGKETTYTAHENGALPRDVINISTLAGGAALKERAIYCKTCGELVSPQGRHSHEGHDLIIHPTQKPLDLCNKLIQAARPQGKPFTVLIPFAGSGSECVSAVKNGGDFIGFEINPDYVLLAEERIDEVFNQQDSCFLNLQTASL